jgi:hypothetical protein
VRIFLLTF